MCLREHVACATCLYLDRNNHDEPWILVDLTTARLFSALTAQVIYCMVLSPLFSLG